ncbi:MAG: hypothetical protein RRZ34_00795 [Malacoplasma sp.]
MKNKFPQCIENTQKQPKIRKNVANFSYKKKISIIGLSSLLGVGLIATTTLVPIALTSLNTSDKINSSLDFVSSSDGQIKNQKKPILSFVSQPSSVTMSHNDDSTILSVNVNIANQTLGVQPSYQWFVSTTENSNWKPIANVNQSSYVYHVNDSQDFTKKYFKCEVSYKNAQTISSNVAYVERLEEPQYEETPPPIYLPPSNPPIIIIVPSKPSKPIPLDPSLVAKVEKFNSGYFSHFDRADIWADFVKENYGKLNIETSKLARYTLVDFLKVNYTIFEFLDVVENGVWKLLAPALDRKVFPEFVSGKTGEKYGHIGWKSMTPFYNLYDNSPAPAEPFDISIYPAADGYNVKLWFKFGYHKDQLDLAKQNMRVQLRWNSEWGHFEFVSKFENPNGYARPETNPFSMSYVHPSVGQTMLVPHNNEVVFKGTSTMFPTLDAFVKRFLKTI